MAREIYVTPAQGLVVRDPNTGEQLSADGAWKPDGQHWRRAERDGSVILSKGPAKPRKPKTED